MKEYETLVLNAEERIREIEVRLFREVCCAELAAFHAASCSTRPAPWPSWMCWLRWPRLLRCGGYICPQVVAEDVLEIRDGRHPVVEQMLERRALCPQ